MLHLLFFGSALMEEKMTQQGLLEYTSMKPKIILVQVTTMKLTNDNHFHQAITITIGIVGKGRINI